MTASWRPTLSTILSQPPPKQADIPQAAPWPVFPPATRFRLTFTDECHDYQTDVSHFPLTGYPSFATGDELARMTDKQFRRAYDAMRERRRFGQASMVAWHPELRGEFDCSTDEADVLAAARLWALARERGDEAA